jgi:hypothetical protein
MQLPRHFSIFYMKKQAKLTALTVANKALVRQLCLALKVQHECIPRPLVKQGRGKRGGKGSIFSRLSMRVETIVELNYVFEKSKVVSSQSNGTVL